MTKVATATTVVRMADQGLLELDVPIGVQLPEYDGGRHVQPTVRQLLTHTAGLGSPLPIRWVRPIGQPANGDLVASILRKHGRPRRAPGKGASYSNIGYLLAGQVIEAVTDMPVEEVVTDVLLRPLGMDSTGYDYDPARPQATGYVRAPRALAPVLRRLLPDGVLGDRVGAYTSLELIVPVVLVLLVRMSRRLSHSALATSAGGTRVVEHARTTPSRMRKTRIMPNAGNEVIGFLVVALARSDAPVPRDDTANKNRHNPLLPVRANPAMKGQNEPHQS